MKFPTRSRAVVRASALGALCTATVLAGIGGGTPANAQFPGANGHIVFVSGEDSMPANGELRSVNGSTEPLGGPSTRLTLNSTIEIAPAWAPDGERLAFTRFPGSGNCCPTGDWDVWVRHTDGTEQQITSSATTGATTGAGSLEWNPSFAPSGNKIVFESNPTGVPQDTSTRLYVVNSDGSGQPTRVTSSSVSFELQPDWSPDGTRMAFTGGSPAATGTGEIYIVNVNPATGVATSAPQQLTFEALTVDSSPTFSPDGSKLAFDSNRDGDYDIYVLDLNNLAAGPTQLTQNTANDFLAEWSPDGTKIAFNSDRTGNSDVFAMNADGTNQVNLTNNPVSEAWVAWQPLSVDRDGDGVNDDADNCPDAPNAGQADLDGDGLGDACDNDRDGDGVSNVTDNCPELSNTAQEDLDGDGLGNACDPLSYAFNGFFRPINNLPTVNTVKAGSAVPVKFALGGDQGLNIFEPGSPSSGRVTTDPNAPLDNIEVTVTGGQSGLQYDPVADVYTYVWKTDPGWAGTTRQLEVRLNDGSVHTARFLLK